MSIENQIVGKINRNEELFRVLDHLENIVEIGITHESALWMTHCK